MNLPNLITLSRLVLTAVFIAATTYGTREAHWWALGSFVLAAVSDWLDGYLARKMNLVTALGKLMDPLADKILVAAAFVFLSSSQLCPVWVTSLILAREFLVTGLRQLAVEAGIVLPADRLGKWKTTFQLIFCASSMLWLSAVGTASWQVWVRDVCVPGGLLHQVSLWGALGLTLWSGGNYLWNSRALLREK